MWPGPVRNRSDADRRCDRNRSRTGRRDPATSHEAMGTDHWTGASLRTWCVSSADLRPPVYTIFTHSCYRRLGVVVTSWDECSREGTDYRSVKLTVVVHANQPPSHLTSSRTVSAVQHRQQNRGTSGLIN